ncbi:putative plant self-incompatibility S1 [Helianthus anomalus]
MSFLLKPLFGIFLLFHNSVIIKANTLPSSKPFEPYRITINNNNVPKVVVGCDDIGGDILAPGNSISWKFRMTWYDTNQYNCRFYWLDDKTLQILNYNTFSVFDKSFMKDELCGYNAFAMSRCYWYITQDGFYFANDSYPWKDWQMMHGWNKI